MNEDTEKGFAIGVATSGIIVVVVSAVSLGIQWFRQRTRASNAKKIQDTDVARANAAFDAICKEKNDFIEKNPSIPMDDPHLKEINDRSNEALKEVIASQNKALDALIGKKPA